MACATETLILRLRPNASSYRRGTKRKIVERFNGYPLAQIFNFCKKYFQLILEAPDDITDVRFSVHDTHLIAATVHSGMILVWDVGQYESLFKGLPGAISAEAGKLPTTYPVAATLENSSGIARHIQWVPSYVEVSFST